MGSFWTVLPHFATFGHFSALFATFGIGYPGVSSWYASPMPSSPTARTLERLRRDGYLAQVVERWNPHARVRQDLYGVIDVLGINETSTIGVQATTMSGRSSHMKKLSESPAAVTWTRGPDRHLELWCWRKLKNRWRVHRTVFDVDDAQQELVVVEEDRGISGG